MVINQHKNVCGGGADDESKRKWFKRILHMKVADDNMILSHICSNTHKQTHTETKFEGNDKKHEKNEKQKN